MATVADGAMSYYGLSFAASVQHVPEPLAIIRVDPSETTAPRKAVKVLREGGLLAFPTAAGYLVGCSALNTAAVERLTAVTGAAREALQWLAASPEQAARLPVPAQVIHDPLPVTLMRDAGTPMAATPPRPGEPPAPTAQHVVFVLGDRIDLVLDGGPVRRPMPVGAR
jgi:tRNA A37 threonylcarbamoyladenosine synthetase subunit TsaC/SUA5/YrdC